MTVGINHFDIPDDGIQIDCEVAPSVLPLSPEDGEIVDPLHCSGHLSRSGEQVVYFQGTLSGRVVRECVRCLGRYEDIVFLPCEAVFRKSGNLGGLNQTQEKLLRARGVDFDEDETAETEAYPIVGNVVDLLPMIREQLILATPMQCLCQEECQGLCQTCGINLNEGVCKCYRPVTVSTGTLDAAQPLLKPNLRKSVPKRT